MQGISSRQLCALALLALVPLVSFLPSASSHKVTRYIDQLHCTEFILILLVHRPFAPSGLLRKKCTEHRCTVKM